MCMVMPKAFLFVVVGYVIEVPALVRVGASPLVETREKCILFSETKNHGGPHIDKHKIYISE